VHLVSCAKQALPSCYGIRPNNGAISDHQQFASGYFYKWSLVVSLLGFEVKAIVLGRTSVLLDKFLAKLILDFDEIGLIVSRRESLSQLLESGGQSVVGLVARSP